MKILKSLLLCLAVFRSEPSYGQYEELFDYMGKMFNEVMRDTTGTSNLMGLKKVGEMNSEELDSYNDQLMRMLKDLMTPEEVPIGFEALGLKAFEKENYQEAIDNFEQFASESKSAGNKKNYARAVRNLSTAHAYVSSYKKAVYYGLEALQLDEELKDTIGLATDYIALGMVQLGVKDFDKAAVYLEKALPLCAGKNWRLERNANYFMGSINSSIKKHESAKSYFKKAKELDKKANHLNNLIDDCVSLGYTYFSTAPKDTINAMRCLVEGGKLVQQNLGQASSVGALVKLAGLQRMVGKYYDAEQGLKMIRSLGPMMDRDQDVAKATELLAYVYADQGQYTEAYKTFLEYRDMSDSLFNEEKNREVKKLEVEYETAKKERALAKSEKERQQMDLVIARQEKDLFSAKLIQAEKEKLLALAEAETKSKEKQVAEGKLQLAETRNAKLAAESKVVKQRTQMFLLVAGAIVLLLVVSGIYYYIQNERTRHFESEIRSAALVAHKSQMDQHVTFNSLQSLRKFLLFEPNRADEYLQRFSSFIRSALQNSGTIDIPLKQELKELENYLQLEQMRFDEPFDYSINVAEGIDSALVNIPSLIFQPLVENTIVHGFSGIDYKGHISVNVSVENKHLVCTVNDNGVGRKPKPQLQEPGRKSMGVDLTRKRIHLYNQVKKQEAVFQIKDLEQGVEVKFTLPMIKAA